MTRQEANDRFNALPMEHRVTIIGNDLENEIRWLEREKRQLIKAHKKNLTRLNERISSAEKRLKKLS